MKQSRNLMQGAVRGIASCDPAHSGFRASNFALRPSFGSRPSEFEIRSSARAFTLVEVLLALAICAIVLVAMNAVFATAVHLRDKTSKRVDEGLPINRAFELLRADLKGAVGPGGFIAGDFKCGAQTMGASMGLSGEAGGSGLDFFTSTGHISDTAPWGDLQEVFYELKAPTERTNNSSGMDLVRCVNRNVLGTMVNQTPDIQCLVHNVQSVEFECFDGMQWRNIWDTSSGDTNLPQAVRIQVQMASKAGEDITKLKPLEMLVLLGTQTVRTNALLTSGGGQ